MSIEYKQPILTSIFNILGILSIIGAAIGGAMICSDSLSEGIAVIIGGVFAGIVYIGIGQAVDYLARTAYTTSQLSTILETSVMQRLASIESRFSPATTLTVRIDSTPPPPSSRGGDYYYAADGTTKGPRSVGDLRRLWKEGIIRLDTPVLRDGETQWRTYGELLDLKKKSGEEAPAA
jgi:hypothetical protein